MRAAHTRDKRGENKWKVWVTVGGGGWKKEGGVEKREEARIYARCWAGSKTSLPNTLPLSRASCARASQLWRRKRRLAKSRQQDKDPLVEAGFQIDIESALGNAGDRRSAKVRGRGQSYHELSKLRTSRSQ